jgi:hypothetical protein
MSRFREQLTSRENLVWAWQKAKRLYDSADGPVDWGAITAFELDLERQLDAIAKDFTDLKYRLTPLILLPQPKKPDDEGNPRLRQSFHVAVRDQVAWLALVNVVGPTLDAKIPPWVYGHRLYKAAWFEEEENQEPRLTLGPYRHSTGALYRKFKHSWPLFRRHISLTARRMVNAIPHEEQLDPSERSALNYEDSPIYLSPLHWPAKAGPQLHYVSIDLEKFYPSIERHAILTGLRRYLPGYSNDPWLSQLVERLLDFRVSRHGSTLLGHKIVQPLTKPGSLSGVPTGLMAAGFLSNVAMLRLDRLAARRVRRDSSIAQFRFVDDHALLAYDFDRLCAWVRWYEAMLARMGIGPRISATKFDPLEMADAYTADAGSAEHQAAREKSKIDGRHPSALMTKTLALVSELAGADFDTLSAQSKGERLNELEWLLLADLPDREIRSDTRAAFAAGRIANLVPIAATPSMDLLHAVRLLALLEQQLKDLKGSNDKAKEALTERRDEQRDLVGIYSQLERNAYTKRVDHYFKLMLQALLDHPDKPRLFIRVLDYCRATGHSGTGSILKWLWSHEDAPLRPLAAYLRTLAIQTIARHAATAGRDFRDGRLLARQRLSAVYYLISLGAPDTRKLLKATLDAAGPADAAMTCAAEALRAGIAFAADATQVRAASSKLRQGMETLRDEIGAIPLNAPSSDWARLTRYPLGVWTHWLEGRSSTYRLEPSKVWRRTLSALNATIEQDWHALRKGLPMLNFDQLGVTDARDLTGLKPSDAGLVLEALRSNPTFDLSARPREPQVAKQLRRHLAELSRRDGFVSLESWVVRLRADGAGPHDPRRSEWTALEVLRQLLAAIVTFPGIEATALDNLHPSNILIPKVWLDRPPPGQSRGWTWETWRHAVRSPKRSVTVVRNPVLDYRRRSPRDDAIPSSNRDWQSRLRGSGLLLVGLLAQDFRLPVLWNVRGLERNVSGFVRAVLEETPASSKTHAIIEAALLPRSNETALMRLEPWVFFGDRTVRTINDTRTDPPLITGIEELLQAIVDAQATLESRQISVLDHAPRQLIPMNVLQLIGAAVEMPEAEVDE